MSAAPAVPERRARPTGPAGLPRLLAGLQDDRRPTTYRAHVEQYGITRDAIRGGELVDELTRSGLTGRGGGSFPTANKLRAVAAAGSRPVVLVNGAEVEPLSAKDRALLASVPHLVLDGAVLAADALGAREIFVAVSRESTLAVAAVENAIAERAAGGDPRVSFRLVPIPPGFVAGEETALVQFVNGGPPKPTFTPPRPFQRGIGRLPTLVQNVETLAQLALVARFGGDWFRELGTEDEPGSTLVTVSGAVRRRGVYEVALGTPLTDVLDEAGGLAGAVSGFLVGGYFGAWISTDAASTVRLLDADLDSHGGMLGARGIAAMPADACALAEVARVTAYLAGESAGQCGPCTYGLAAISGGLDRLVTGTGDERARLRRWAETVRGRGACRHPDGATRFVESALKVFGEEVETHLRYGRCRSTSAGVLPIPQERRP